jgi:hypothetical protein
MAALVSNIHYNLTAWASGTYTVGQRLSNAGNAYQCIISGLSTVAPTGTGSSISNGGAATFKWLSAIDYTNVQDWQNGIPGTLTQPVVGQIWNNGPIPVNVGGSTPGAFFNVTGHVTSTTNNITITAAPGESFRDKLTVTPSSGALAFNASNGVALVAPSSGTTSGNFIQIDDSNVILSNIQVQDPNATSGASLMLLGSNVTVQNCILDATSQKNVGMVNAFPFTPGDASSTAIFTNCLFVDRVGAADPFSTTVSFFYPGIVANCTFETVNTGANVAAVISIDPTTTNVRITNSIFARYSGNVFSNFAASTFTVDHSVFTASSIVDGGVTVGAGNIFNASAGSLFSVDGSNFRLGNSSPAINAGTTDTTDIPSATDILGTPRPQGSAWDIGAFELAAAGVNAVVSRVSTVQEYPSNLPTSGWSFTRSGVPPSLTGIRIPRGASAIVRQEQPPPNVSFVNSARQINFVASPRRWGNYAVTIQEQPRHPAPYVTPSVAGRSVAPPSRRIVATTITEQPPPNVSFTHPGPPGPDVVTVGTLDAAITIDPLGTQTANTAFAVTGSFTLYPQLSFTDDAGGTFTPIADANETPIGTSEYAFVHPGMPVGNQTLIVEDLSTSVSASITYPVTSVTITRSLLSTTAGFPPSAPTGLTKVTPAYLYDEYSDDDDVRAFFTAYNNQAQVYLDWFNTINLPIYTGAPIVGQLLDWVAAGLYGITRPVIAFTVVLGDGPFATDPLDYVTFAGAQSVGSSTVFTVTDDVFKRIITWNFYKGDGKVFNIRWLKRRIARFLAGTNGTDYTGPTYQISVSFTGKTTVNIAINSGAIATTYAPIFQAAILSGVLPLPFQYTYNVLLSSGGTAPAGSGFSSGFSTGFGA